MRLTRAIWALLVVSLVAAIGSTWWLTRPEAPEPPWVGAVSVLADDAGFSEPFGVSAAPDGSLYVSDAGTSHRIRRIATDGSVTLVAGGGRGFADGRGADARFATPSHIALGPDGTLVVADTGNHAIRRVAPDGTVTTAAGDGVAGYEDGPAGRARFNAPVGVAVDRAGRIIVADTYNDRIRVIDPDGHVRTLAGGDAPGLNDGVGPDARLDTPCGVAIDARGRILVADTGNGLLRAIDPDGTVTTVATPGVVLERPMAIAVDARGDAYVADEGGLIVVLPAQGDPRLLAGGAPGFTNGVGADAAFRRPSAIGLVGPAGPAGHHRSADIHLLVADAGNAMVRLVTPTDEGRAGSPSRPFVGPYQWPWTAIDLPTPARPLRTPAFDAEAFARVPLLWPVAPMDGPHEVAGTFGEARGEPGQERFHAGLDIREVQGTLVRAVREGIVSSPFSTFGFDTLNEGLRIGDLAYIHIRVGRDRSPSGPSGPPSLDTAGSASRPYQPPLVGDLQRFAPVYDEQGVMVRMRVKRGAHFPTGEVVGSVNAFNHVHLNVGWSGEEHNPLRFRLVQFRDGIPPTIEAGGIRLFDDAWQPLGPTDGKCRDAAMPECRSAQRRRRKVGPVVPTRPIPVRGRVRIVVDAWDQADGNKAYRRLGVYAVGYSVLSAASADRTSKAEPAARRRRTSAGLERRTPNATSGWPTQGSATSKMAPQQFDRMRRDSDAPRLVYATGSGIPVHGARRTQFLYVATTTFRDGVATPGFWDTTVVAPGDYVLRVFVEDFSGNRTSRDLRVVVMPSLSSPTPSPLD